MRVCPGRNSDGDLSEWPKQKMRIINSRTKAELLQCRDIGAAGNEFFCRTKMRGPQPRGSNVSPARKRWVTDLPRPEPRRAGTLSDDRWESQSGNKQEQIPRHAV